MIHYFINNNHIKEIHSTNKNKWKKVNLKKKKYILQFLLAFAPWILQFYWFDKCMLLPYYYHIEWLYHPESPLCPAYVSLPYFIWTLAATDLGPVVFAFPECLLSLVGIVFYVGFETGIFDLEITHLRFFPFYKIEYNWHIRLYYFRVYNIWLGICRYCEMITVISPVNICTIHPYIVIKFSYDENF